MKRTSLFLVSALILAAAVTSGCAKKDDPVAPIIHNYNVTFTVTATNIAPGTAGTLNIGYTASTATLDLGTAVGGTAVWTLTQSLIQNSALELKTGGFHSGSTPIHITESITVEGLNSGAPVSTGAGDSTLDSGGLTCSFPATVDCAAYTLPNN